MKQGAPLRIAAVLPNFAGGGAERVVLKLMSAAAVGGMHTTLVVLNESGPLRADIPKDLRIVSLEKARLRDALLPLVLALRHAAPDVVFSSIGYVNLALAALRLFYPGRLVIREANMPSLSLPRNPSPRVMRIGYRLLYRRADAVLATSRQMADELSAFAVPTSRLSILPNPVDVEGLRRVATDPQRLPGAGRRFVAAGRLVPQKGFDRLIPVLAGIPEAGLTILGDGPQKDELTVLAKRHGVALHLPGFVSNAAAWFAGADAFLLPSRWEGMPNVALEALACGTPVIAAPEAGGISEVGAMAQDGAVTVAAMEEDFRVAIEAVAARPQVDLRPSLLPGVYEIGAVSREFLDIVQTLDSSEPECAVS